MSMYVYTPYAILSTNDNSAIDYLSIYPNPITDKINLKINSDEVKSATIIDVNGKIIVNTEIDKSQLTLYRENSPSGLYFLILQDQNNTILETKKLIFK